MIKLIKCISLFLLIVIVSFSFLPMEISANENADIVSANQLSNDESDNLIIEENEMQPESSTIIASGSRGENQEIKWTLDTDGLLYVYGTGDNIDLSYLAYHANIEDMIKSAKIQISGSFYLKGMFSLCTFLEKVDFMNSNYKALSLNYMFYNCLNLKTIYFSNIDTRNVTDMKGMFGSCSSLETLDLSKFNTSKVTDMSAMFYTCESLKTLDLSNFDTRNVTGMLSVFYECKNLKTLDLSNFDTRNVIDMGYMFSNCESLKTLDLSNFDTRNVTDMEYMFTFCKSLETLDLSDFDTRNVTNMKGMFAICSSLETLDLSKFNTSKVTDMSIMFDACENLKTLDLSNFDTGNVESMNGMFTYCKLLDELNLSSFNTGNVENMNGMFDGCVSLKTLDLSHFDTSKVTDMKAMFLECYLLQSVNLSGFNTENLTNMTSMFRNCQCLQNIDLSGFKTDKVTSMKYMFYGCESLKNLDISNFNMSSLAYEDGEGMKIFSTMDSIETIKMPANLTYSIALPYEQYMDSTGALKNRKVTWYDQSGNQCYSTLTGQSIPVLYRRDNKARLITSFVERMYTVVLNRSAEKGGLTYWSGELKNGTGDAAALARGFIGSEEFKARGLDDSAFLDVLYKTFFDRAADGEGKAYWLGELANGSGREFVLSQFVNSREFAEICDSYEIARGTMEADGSSIYNAGVRNFVLRNYTKALGRGGETEGVEYWSHLINTRQMTALDCAMSFFHSQEFLNKNLSDPDYVETLYATYFDRVSDAEGKAYWLNQMQNGMSRDDVLTEFAYSQEFKQIMSGYGL